MAYMEGIKFGVVLACFLSGSEIMILLIMLAFLRLIDDKRKGAEDVCLCAGEFAPESEERDSVKEEEIVRSAKKEEASAPAPSEERTAPDQAEKAEESEEEEEEERVEEFTEIVETFQSSEDGGKTWKTYRKIIRITPEGTSENVELIEDTSAPGSNFAAEAASRLSSQPDAQVLHSSVSGGRSAKKYPEDEKKVTCSQTYRNPNQGKMDDLVVEGPELEQVDVKEESEVLPDGTVHSTQRVSHHKVKHVRRTHTSPTGKEEVFEEDVEVPGTSKEDVYELFEQPPKVVHEEEDIEQVLDDGTKVKKHVVMSRMVHLVKMHHESFDEDHHKTEEDYEIEEVVPGTESAFVAGMDSDSDEDGKSEPKRNQKQVSSGAGAESSSGPGAGPVCADDDSDTAYPKLVSYLHGSDVDGGSQSVRYGPRESALDVVEDMLAKGQLTLEDTEVASTQQQCGKEAAAAAAAAAAVADTDTDTPVIVITEDHSAPPDEDEDVPSYFGVKYEVSSEGDDNNDIIGAPGDEDYGYTHRVVMKKEVHQRTTIRPDGQEDTVITEDSQVHQDSDPPGELRQSMEQIIQQFMHDSPRMQRQEDEPDEGTEV